MTLPGAPPSQASGEPSAAGSTVRVLHSFAEAEAYHVAWNQLVGRSGADIYQTFEWCRHWWIYYGEGRNLNLLLCLMDDELVGVVPAFVEHLWLGPVRIRVAKLIGADFSLQLCNLPVLPDALDATLAAAIEQLLGEQGCDLLVLGPLSGPCARIDEILAVGQKHGHLVKRAESLGHSISTRFELPKNFEEYQSAIGSRQRGNYKRSVTQLAKSHRVVTDQVSDADEVLREFDAFQSLHEAQWAAESRLGHFGDWPKSAEFNRSLVATLGKCDMVRFFRILADGRVASSQYCFWFGATNYWRLPGRECRTEWDNLSLGKMGLIQMIEASLAEGAVAVEGGRGHYDYKLQLGGKEWPLRSIQLQRRGLGVALRVRAFRVLARLLNLIYYKIYYVRLAPKFPRLQRSLWPLWIRCTW